MKNLENTLLILSCICFASYNILGLIYSQKILLDFRKKYLGVIFTTFINTLLLFYGFYNDIPLPIRYIIAFIVLILEFKLFSNSRIAQIIFGASMFIIHIILIELLTLSTMSLVTSSNIYEISHNNVTFYINIIITFLISPIALIIFNKFIIISDIKLISETKKYVNGINLLACVIICYLCIDSIMFHINESFLGQEEFIILTCLLTMIILYTVLIHTLKICKNSHQESRLNMLKRQFQEHVEVEDKLKIMAFRDHLTGSFSRGYMLEKFQKYLDDKKNVFCIAFIDIDNLKYVNDTFGHKEGDNYICSVAKMLSYSIRQFDILARMGGDEFMILFNNTDEKNAEIAMQRSINNILKLSKSLDIKYNMSISYGLCTITEDSNLTINQIIEQADAKMYKNKTGKNVLNH